MRAKTAEPTELPFGMMSGVGPRNHVGWACTLANTVERLCAAAAATRCGELRRAVSSQITSGVLVILSSSRRCCDRFAQDAKSKREEERQKQLRWREENRSALLQPSTGATRESIDSVGGSGGAGGARPAGSAAVSSLGQLLRKETP